LGNWWFRRIYPEEYGGAGLDQISYGLIMQIEHWRFWCSFYFICSISSLVMYPIWKYGNERRMKYLPKLATGEFMGFTVEPNYGSDQEV
jgi:glutaryl-CoA dehydrogenase